MNPKSHKTWQMRDNPVSIGYTTYNFHWTAFITLLFFFLHVVIKLIKSFVDFYPFLFKNYFLLSFLNLIFILGCDNLSTGFEAFAMTTFVRVTDSIRFLQVYYKSLIFDSILIHFGFVFYIAFVHDGLM